MISILSLVELFQSYAIPPYLQEVCFI